MFVRLPPVLFSLSSLSVSSVKFCILENFTLYLRNTWSLNLRAIESCVCSIRSIERKMGPILRTVYLSSSGTKVHVKLKASPYLSAARNHNILHVPDWTQKQERVKLADENKLMACEAAVYRAVQIKSWWSWSHLIKPAIKMCPFPAPWDNNN